MTQKATDRDDAEDEMDGDDMQAKRHRGGIIEAAESLNGISCTVPVPSWL